MGGGGGGGIGDMKSNEARGLREASKVGELSVGVDRMDPKHPFSIQREKSIKFIKIQFQKIIQ